MNIIYMILTSCSGEICSVAQFLTLAILCLVAVVALPVGLVVVPAILLSIPLIGVVKWVRGQVFKWNIGHENRAAASLNPSLVPHNQPLSTSCTAKGLVGKWGRCVGGSVH